MMEKENHYLGHRKRLRERFEKNGLDAFQDYEAVELLSTLAIPRKDVKPSAKEAIKRFGTFQGVIDAPIEELRQIPGIGEVTPIAIRFIREAANRYLQEKSQDNFSPQDQESLYSYCRAALEALTDESFKVIYLNSRLQIIGDETIAEGTIDRATVYPRRVMETALKNKAFALLFAHNHPNGDVTPSEYDKTLTRALVLAAKTLQINVFDHLIVSKDKVFSFRENGLL